MVMSLFVMTTQPRRVGILGPGPCPSEASGKGGKGREPREQYERIRGQKGKQSKEAINIHRSVTDRAQGPLSFGVVPLSTTSPYADPAAALACLPACLCCCRWG